MILQICLPLIAKYRKVAEDIFAHGLSAGLQSLKGYIESNQLESGEHALYSKGADMKVYFLLRVGFPKAFHDRTLVTDLPVVCKHYKHGVFVSRLHPLELESGHVVLHDYIVTWGGPPYDWEGDFTRVQKFERKKKDLHRSS